MKKIYTLLIIILCSTLSYTQDPELFEHTWYFHHGVLNEEPFFPTENQTAELLLNQEYDIITVGYPYCEGGVSFEEVIYDTENNSFEITGDYYILVDSHCSSEQDELQFMQKHNFIFGDLSSGAIYFNPFFYTIENIDDYYQLTMENGEGDWAVYNNINLSVASFNQNVFSIYPNPVSKTLHIVNNENVIKTSIYSITGQQMAVFNDAVKEIDVRQLQNGLYFLVLEKPGGKEQAVKFVKK